MTAFGPDPRSQPPALPAEEAAALAGRHGLAPVGRRPSLPAYLRDAWRYRHLIWSMAKGEVVGQYRDNYLGLVWAVLTPILVGVTYYLIFGVLFGLRDDVDNFVGFLTIGLFVFTFISSVLTSGSRVLLGKVGVMRSLAFPRIVLPMVTVLSSFLSNLPAFGVLVVVALITDEPVTWEWLLFPVALLVVGVIGLGLAMIVARLVHAVRDLANLVPVAVRLLRYASGVFFSIETRISGIEGAPDWLGPVMELQPFALSLTLVRQTLLSEFALDPVVWLAAVGWAVGLLVVGLLVFWRGEGTYGRA